MDPNPAVEGQPVTITVTGPGPWYVVPNPSGEPKEYKPDAHNEIELLAPPGNAGGSFTITDFGDPATEIRVDIVSSD
ncbi:MAG TPA: hypothetical protein VK081_01285 [Planctomycetota bacterium]|nr:hypothetical protein [Planctomycetota bacterium]